MQIVIMFGQGLTFLGLLGPYLQAYSEAKAAAIEAFKVIDEVLTNKQLFIFFMIVLLTLHYLGIRSKYL